LFDAFMPRAFYFELLCDLVYVSARIRLNSIKICLNLNPGKLENF
jgi:hypothetical protein